MGLAARAGPRLPHSRAGMEGASRESSDAKQGTPSAVCLPGPISRLRPRCRVRCRPESRERNARLRSGCGGCPHRPTRRSGNLEPGPPSRRGETTRPHLPQPPRDRARAERDQHLRHAVTPTVLPGVPAGTQRIHEVTHVERTSLGCAPSSPSCRRSHSCRPAAVSPVGSVPTTHMRHCRTLPTGKRRRSPNGMRPKRTRATESTA